MGMFDGISEAQVSKSGQYFKPGNYRVRIKGVKEVDSATAPGKKFFVIETEVLESSNPDIGVGTERSHVITMGQTMSLPNVKAFVAAASGVDPNAEDVNAQVEAYWQDVFGEYNSFDKVCDIIVGDLQPLLEAEMDLECVEILTKGEGKPFTKHTWRTRDLS